MNTVMLYPQCLYHFYPMLQHILTTVHHLPLITIKISSIPRSFISIRCALLQAVSFLQSSGIYDSDNTEA